jgi:nickel transport protein
MFPNTIKSFWNWCYLISFSFSFFIAVITTSAALAHNVTIFAWVEDDMVYTESKFSGGRKAKNAPVEVYDAAGTKLISGKTDENGEFSFKLPKKEELKIVLLAGLGHGNEWILTAEDIAEAQNESSGSTSDPPSNQLNRLTPLQIPSTNKESKENLTTTDLKLQTLLEKMLDKKLTPILKKLNYLEAKQKKERGVTEILGGIGYILGLMGLAAFIHYRRRINAQDIAGKTR